MSILMGWLVLNILGGSAEDSVPPPPPVMANVQVQVEKQTIPAELVDGERPQHAVESRFIEADAVAWRKSVYKHCTRVGKQGVATVWLVDDASVKALIEVLQSDRTANLIQAPKVTSFDGVPAVTSMKHTRAYVADLERVAKESNGRVEAIAWKPISETVDEGVQVRTIVKRDGTGEQVRLDLESQWLCGLTQAVTSEAIENDKYGKTTLNAVLQLPQVVHAQLSSTFSVPENKSLLISLGTATVADAHGKAVVRERLALITPHRILSEKEETRVKVSRAATRLGELPATVARASTPIPRTPSRSLPVGHDLPPLPPDTGVRTTSFDSVPAPQASPQTPTPPQANANVPSYSQMMRRDPNVGQASYEPLPAAPSTLLPPAAVPQPVPVPSPNATVQKIRIPIVGNLGIEVEVRVK